MRLASFDIFDTSLIRRCGHDAVYGLLADRLYSGDEAKRNAFLKWRLEAGQMAYKAFHGVDNTLSELYSLFKKETFSEYTAEQVMAIEKDIESENLTAYPYVRDIIRQKREEGFTIAFISDMYLDSLFLKEILMREGCAEAEDKVYVSCEYRARKDLGGLYDVVRQDLQPTSWVHYGDNLRSDVKNAHKHGIEAIKIETSMTPAERYVLQTGKTTADTHWSLLPAISRAARLMHGNTSYAAMAADFVAPAYIPYVYSLLSDASKRGIRRLYFLSRDSYILMCIAEAFTEEFPEIELRYLFVSRRSLTLPYLFGGNEEKFLTIADHHTIVRQGSVEKYLQLLGTTREEMSRQFGITFNYGRANDKQQEADFLDKVFKSGYTPVLQQRASEAHTLLKDYLIQEGLGEGKKSAMVDVGWLGTTRLIINDLLKRNGMREVEFYYYGIRGDVLPETAGKYTSYFKKGELSTGATGLIENYYSASPYPSTIGYEKDDRGHIIPVFSGGKSYEDTEITRSNISVACSMAKEVSRLGLANKSEMLKRWVEISIDTITTTNIDIDLSPLTVCADFDAEPFVKRMSTKELTQHILMGKHITAFDWASLRLTLPHWAWNISKRLSHVTGHLRRQFYLRLMTNQ